MAGAAVDARFELLAGEAPMGMIVNPLSGTTMMREAGPCPASPPVTTRFVRLPAASYS
ncbi:hypothetical protein D3C72_2335650 [compost metagenome]